MISNFEKKKDNNQQVPNRMRKNITVASKK